MLKINWKVALFVFLWSLIMLLLFTALLIGVKATSAQDNPVSSCYTRTDAGAIFTFSNIPDIWFLDRGWYYIGDDVQVEDHTLIVTGLQFDEGYSYAVVGTNDSGENYTASTDLSPVCGDQAIITPEPTQNAPEPLIARNNDIPAAVVSTGRTCTVKYPQIILVCHG